MRIKSSCEKMPLDLSFTDLAGLLERYRENWGLL